jgi:hypothetical protein
LRVRHALSTGAVRLDVDAQLRARPVPSSTFRLGLRGVVMAGGPRVDVDARSREGVRALVLRVVAERGRIGIARAHPGGAAWTVRLGGRLQHQLEVEVGLQGWRGGRRGRVAAEALGGVPSLQGRRLGPVAARGTIGSLRVGWQGRGVRVRLAAGRRQVPRGAPVTLVVGQLELAWR